jgi:hypothetical protein
MAAHFVDTHRLHRVDLTHEEIFRELRDFCQEQSKNPATFSRRKFFYL